MTDEFSFIIVALALLATPGPTNTLLATSGAASGFRKSLVLLFGEFLGYMIAIAVLIAAMGPIIARAPNFGLALRIVSGLYLLHVAWKLWGHTEEMLLRKGGVSLRTGVRHDAPQSSSSHPRLRHHSVWLNGRHLEICPLARGSLTAYCDCRLMLDSGRVSIAEGHGSYSERAQMLPRRSDRSDAVCGIDLRKCNCRRLAPIADPPNPAQT